MSDHADASQSNDAEPVARHAECVEFSREDVANIREALLIGLQAMTELQIVIDYKVYLKSNGLDAPCGIQDVRIIGGNQEKRILAEALRTLDIVAQPL